MKLKCLALFAIGFCFISTLSFAQPWLTSGSNIYFNSGNVGIGTSTPSAKLHVVGDVLFTGWISSPGASNYSEKFGAGSILSGTYSTAIGAQSIAYPYGTAIGGGALGGYTGSTLSIGIGYGANNRGSYSTVIGTSTVGAGSQFNTVIGNYSSTSYYGTIVIGNGVTATKDYQAIIGSAVGQRISEVVLGMGAISPYANLYGGVVLKTTDGDGTNINGSDLKINAGSGTGSGTGGFISFATAAPGSTGSTLNTAVESMRITPQANIGIGTTTPNANAKLHVVGNIYCNNKVYIGTPQTNTVDQIADYALAVNGTAIFTKAKVKLYGTWADYVFEPGYKLLNLYELETYLQKNKHLPEVPSAAEVEKDGIDLGDNQTILLKKVEELTLYIIELNKRIDQLTVQKNAKK